MKFKKYRMTSKMSLLSLVLVMICNMSKAQEHSVARSWVEVQLDAIRMDFARPPQTARSLHQLSIVMYDVWAVYDSVAEPYFLGHGLGDYPCPFDGVPVPPADSITHYQEQAIHFAAARFIEGRYDYNNPLLVVPDLLDSMAIAHQLDYSFTNTDYSNGDPRALGNYIAQEILAAGLVDGSNEGTGDIHGYQNQFYEPVNDSLDIQFPEYVGNHTIDSLNRWQPISFLLFCDQTFNNFFNVVPEFIGAEWGEVEPFALHESDMEIKEREGHEWKVYMDPGPMPRLDTLSSEESQLHQWNMQMVAKWSGHLDPADTTVWDISPASIGNLEIDDLPEEFADYDQYYDFDNGGFQSPGHPINPITGMEYTPQLVKRGDYARILAEFWADGPDSETPPGHWYAIYNETSDHPLFERKWRGEGPVLDTLEFDLKSYMVLGGALHDAAVACWSIKGYYDFVRPVSSLRAMAELGQISDPNLPNYDATGRGLPLIPGFIEMIEAGDPLAGENDMYLHELKLMCWDGPNDADTCISGLPPVYDIAVAGVEWKLALDWWPYQRPNFISPAFAGYISGHSTFSRAAAEAMTLITGDAFFPGGLAEFECPQEQFLVFEEGPSESITLQWATYQDAADQSGLSRIWGGIHPPCDDIPGRKIGYDIGHEAFALAEVYFGGEAPIVEQITLTDDVISDADTSAQLVLTIHYSQPMDSLQPVLDYALDISSVLTEDSRSWTSATTFEVVYDIVDSDMDFAYVGLSVDSAYNKVGSIQQSFVLDSLLHIDQLNPTVMSVSPSPVVLSLADVGAQNFQIDVAFSEEMDDSNVPVLTFPMEDPASSLTLNESASDWSSSSDYSFVYDVMEGAQSLMDIDVQLSMASDTLGNLLAASDYLDQFGIDIISSLSEIEAAGFTVFPNPTSGLVLIRSKDNIPMESIDIIDEKGQRVLNQKANRSEAELNISILPDGVYLIKVHRKGDSYTQKIVKYSP